MLLVLLPFMLVLVPSRPAPYVPLMCCFACACACACAYTSASAGIVSLARGKQEEVEAKREEKKKRQSAEEAMRALRNRVSYLMTQLNFVSQAAVDWQSEKVVLSSQIASLHNANVELRSEITCHACDAVCGSSFPALHISVLLIPPMGCSCSCSCSQAGAHPAQLHDPSPERHAHS